MTLDLLFAGPLMENPIVERTHTTGRRTPRRKTRPPRMFAQILVAASTAAASLIFNPTLGAGPWVLVLDAPSEHLKRTSTPDDLRTLRVDAGSQEPFDIMSYVAPLNPHARGKASGKLVPPPTPTWDF